MTLELIVDPIACDGHGLCVEALPEVLAVDDWGYPVVTCRTVSPSLEGAAQRAVAICPKLALRLRRVPNTAPAA